MKFQNHLGLARFALALCLPMLCSTSAEAGSNSGSSASTVIGMSCDNRRAIDGSFGAWCTTPTANIIRDKCVVVIHSNQIPNCGWQGCGFVSFVNERPSLVGNSVNEYGISTPSGLISTPPISWEPANGKVMPKSPFPRNYLTVSQFIQERSKCAALSPQARATEIASGSTLGKICGSSLEVMSLNPYYYCMVYRQVIPNMP